jgi:putative transposase
MPSKNANKIQVPDSYYHVYTRGNNKQIIFCNDLDFQYFVGLLERYLGGKKYHNRNSYNYPNYSEKIRLLAYCIMPNHLHLMIYQSELPYLEKFMRSLMTSYSKYFNLKYRRTGPIFESRYKAVRIEEESYLQHISRYIHLNPKKWENYLYSSVRYYLTEEELSWLDEKDVLSIFSSKQEYYSFLSEYVPYRDHLKEIKSSLANN